ncbi:thiamine biosynthetic bifunctional enzyme [Coemansia sp. Benny D115]|nr:thiamine biosynthetic bifunctional enzyme [Coemansia sp. Benny D115]
MVPAVFDLSLYLVTDSRMVPKGRALSDLVQEAILGGVTIVQLREKTAETRDFISLARSVQKVTKKHGIPLLINDRLDVALAVDADGIHIGQSDMPLSEARRILGDNRIIGVSAQTPQEAEEAILGGADYLGIGVCFDTATKNVDPKRLQGPQGIRAIWEHVLGIKNPPKPTRAVTIGGINQYNVDHVMKNTSSENGTQLEGVAVVSAIMAAANPQKAAELLARKILSSKERSWESTRFLYTSVETGQAAMVREMKTAFTRIRGAQGIRPLVQHITNNVVVADSANACLALGGSPIMSRAPDEQQDLSTAISALLINIGTIDQQQIPGIRQAMKHAQLNRTPIVLDPVGVGASEFRKQVIQELLRDYSVDVIKGNAAEISSLLDSQEVSQKGVDSLGKGFANPSAAVRTLSLRHRCLVVMTGEIDYVSDGASVFAIHNGHALQASITGSGCMAGTAIATFIVVGNSLVYPIASVLTGLVAINLSAEHAASRADVKGPGTFVSAFIDEMHNLTEEQFASRARIELV